MVSVVHSTAIQSDDADSLKTLSGGLGVDQTARMEEAMVFAKALYGEALLGSGEPIWPHAMGMALIAAGLKLDADSRIAALLFAVPTCFEGSLHKLEKRFGGGIMQLVQGISRLNRLHPIASDAIKEGAATHYNDPQETRAQIEVLRKMLLAVVEDIRVVILRLASRTQTLRHYAANPHELRAQVASETLALYSPLANRLGVWELKWELEDLSFRFLHPETYRKIARMLDEKRIERELFIASATERLKKELAAINIQAEVYGRPKHIYSIWNKMRKKGIAFSEVYDIRALRVIVVELKDCYAALGVVHNMWIPIPKEFDDYISNPKGNYYRSLHTAVQCPDGRSLEVQIRTHDMHRHAELGIAAHWRYKEGHGTAADNNYDEKIAWLRQLLAWKNETASNSDWVRQYKQAALDETIYVMTPQGKVLDLPCGATPLDFAYKIHTDLGHRCRGVKVDDALVPLNTALKTGQKVEIIAARQGGPSRDWLSASQGYLHTKGARTKVRQWFANLALEETLAEGRAIVTKELQRQGQSNLGTEEIAQRLGFSKADDLFVALARGETSIRQFQNIFKDGLRQNGEAEEEIALRRPAEEPKGILIVGVDKLLTQLARCCKPAPPDQIEGFVTRGKGVSIHRFDCPNFQHLAALHPERVIETAWGQAEADGLFATDIVVDAHDRQGLLRDISEVFAKEKINVIGVHSQTLHDKAHMGFTVEIHNLQQLQHTLRLVHEVTGVVTARRA